MTASAGDFADPAAEAEARLSLAHLSLQYAPSDVVEQCQHRADLDDFGQLEQAAEPHDLDRHVTSEQVGVDRWNLGVAPHQHRDVRP